ncbi:HTH-type transcriptional activator CmpR [Acaryochloris thomasi RCC1774]|uniref:HTH-type transcriptional activator CmpR n=1 Tax=Acaryochloris thomasi RCC1774 TaxID=1764569 RepID=A0A2W1JJ69_9CYAN|nr:LysR family transcriptional regulator [Acaryochloris thomasi]PZD73523.1 HTH-type transcriptional activator CmpR [Acaryochloris thomasi RCC1774]
MQPTLHQLKVFETAARHQSFTRAAEELFLTQPTVSIQMKQLAQTIGLPLFEKLGKQLFLTEAGQELLGTCQDIFERLDQYEMLVADLQGMAKGRLRLAAVTTTKYFVPRLLGPFCQEYPGIDVSLKVTNHRQLEERIANNQDDLYILSQPPEQLNLHVQPFLENPLVVFSPANHPLAHKKGLSIQCLNDEPFITREAGSGTRKAVQELFGEHKVSVKTRLELSSNEAIKQAVAGGLGISVLSRHTLHSGDDKELSILDVEHFPIQRQWYVCYFMGKQLSVVARTFLEHLLKVSEQLAVLYKSGT